MTEIMNIFSKDHIEKRILERFEFISKNKQTDTFYILLNNKEDLIFIVKTEFGKSILFQAALLIYSIFKFFLIIMPLIALQNKQHKKLERIAGCTLFFK